eukprot:7402934-Pyramimonas_sp.AAC.1
MAFSSTFTSTSVARLTHSHRREADGACIAYNRCPCGAPAPQKREGRFPPQRIERGHTTVTRVDLQEGMALTTAVTLTGVAIYLGFKVRSRERRCNRERQLFVG